MPRNRSSRYDRHGHRLPTGNGRKSRPKHASANCSGSSANGRPRPSASGSSRPTPGGRAARIASGSQAAKVEAVSTPLTVWGVAAKVDEIAARYDTWGRLTSAHTIRDFDPDLPDTPIRVTFRHNPTLEIGDLVHAELDPDGRLFAVAGLDSDDLAEHEGRLFYSPDYTGYGRNMGALTFTATRASITGMSVTPRPPASQPKRPRSRCCPATSPQRPARQPIRPADAQPLRTDHRADARRDRRAHPPPRGARTAPTAPHAGHTLTSQIDPDASSADHADATTLESPPDRVDRKRGARKGPSPLTAQNGSTKPIF